MQIFGSGKRPPGPCFLDVSARYVAIDFVLFSEDTQHRIIFKAIREVEASHCPKALSLTAANPLPCLAEITPLLCIC